MRQKNFITYLATVWSYKLHVCLAVSLALSFTPLRFCSFIIILACLASTLPLIISRLTKLVIAYLLISGITCLIAMLGWLYGFTITSGLLLGGYSFSLLSYWMVQPVIRFYHTGVVHIDQPKLTEASKTITVADLASGLVALSLMVVVLLPIVPPTIRTLGPTVINGGDNSAHLELLKADDLNRGFSIWQAGRSNLSPSLGSYPQGWHINGALLKWSIETFTPIAPNPTKILAFFYAYSVLWFGILGFLVTRVTFMVVDGRNKKYHRIALVSVPLVCFGGIAGWILPLFSSGFQAQISALVYLTLEILLIILALQKPPAKRTNLIVLALFSAIITSFMWIFITPIAVLGFLLCFGKSIPYYIRNRPSYHSIVICIFLALIGLTQLYVTALSPSIGGGLDARGYSPMTTMYPLLGLVIISSLYVFVFSKAKPVKIIYGFSLLAIGFSLALMAYQLHALHELRYYYFKSTYTYIIMGIILLGAVIFELLGQSLVRRPSFTYPRLQTPLVLSSFLILITMAFITYKAPQFNNYYHKQMVGISADQATAMANVLHAKTADGYRFATIGSCNRGEDIRAILLSQALTYINPAQAGPRLTLELTPLDEHVAFSQIRVFVRKYKLPIYIASRSQNLSNELLTYLGNDAHYVNLINLDPDSVATAAANCPDRLGGK